MLAGCGLGAGICREQSHRQDGRLGGWLSSYGGGRTGRALPPLPNHSVFPNTPLRPGPHFTLHSTPFTHLSRYSACPHSSLLGPCHSLWSSRSSHSLGCILCPDQSLWTAQGETRFPERGSKASVGTIPSQFQAGCNCPPHGRPWTPRSTELT